MQMKKFTSNFLKYQLIIIVGIFIVLEGWLIYNLYNVVNYEESYHIPQVMGEDDEIRRRLDGRVVDEDQENLYPVAVSIDIHPLMLMVPATISASCAFMMPVATPPNAIVFGTERLTIPQMARMGVILNFTGVILITAALFLLGGVLIP